MRLRLNNRSVYALRLMSCFNVSVSVEIKESERKRDTHVSNIGPRTLPNIVLKTCEEFIMFCSPCYCLLACEQTS